jgi:acylphosphatase
MSEPVARRLVIRGLVQGVGYRYSMLQQAQLHGITGWVRNRRDGSVEAVVKGPPEAVEFVLAWARRGPRGARVDHFEEHPADGDFSGFEQRPTA